MPIFSIRNNLFRYLLPKIVFSPLCHTDCIPTDLKDPFYTDQYEQEHLKPPVASLLLSADLYCRAGSLILKSDTAKSLLGHDAVIQALAQRGLYITDQERLVTERDLRKRPLQMVREIFKSFFFFSGALKRLWLGYTIINVCKNSCSFVDIKLLLCHSGHHIMELLLSIPSMQ